MDSFVPLICPACGSKLAATEDPARYACASCGNEYLLDAGRLLQPPAAEPGAPPRLPPLTGEVRARLEAEARARGEQQQADLRQQQPLAYWLQQHPRGVSVAAVVAALLLMAAVYFVILSH